MCTAHCINDSFNPVFSPADSESGIRSATHLVLTCGAFILNAVRSPRYRRATSPACVVFIVVVKLRHLLLQEVAVLGVTLTLVQPPRSQTGVYFSFAPWCFGWRVEFNEQILQSRSAPQSKILTRKKSLISGQIL